ncbi:MAG: D-glycero-beta-D-manno-heptose 1,7-bisphosphate 7-phosphatase [Candidatus Thiodiazotropha sp. (ex Ctena orbiculata)]|uniref:D,D-heptose 1,7-bisphosphate phosphatase n=1 Tax=Candidatus Thiodiazotropha taylori TaxID=2792791 RepID=A0A944M994_9GAMM|nr:D-glycero-beta-D-manno-heptose 1,7-bisphosphate 7-phosphatase [Candidatus Thiodiazotropha taylori]PUB88772.1 MAG: D-glycero-beta-D-manno-heptose-1,7-bisphosphate 7-phosphatase [gamma proteobacterium symbiont of Ctena orbiculata]MBT2989608.1 D-glycero-beta-D-manno-heptose 1,7-bisphosphate 7-phosphatase [Candidatus Thiodiazotropha taylori]MBT2997188.1 D-glycero-beta-D-manno-heptose 1,7-bisphosphate 7-phosphatase [Candidatus Thiodiazotropha taylori]MBT3001341.1 D-glycero-beta-D-manno-heptose 1,
MKLIILDRDGVINLDSDAYIKSPEEWIPIAESLQAIAKLSRAGYRVFVATNQSGIARGLFDIETLNAIHRKMTDAVQEVGGSIDAVLFCPHGPDDACRCRKPNSGLYEEIARRTQQSLQGVPIVGDSVRDIEAAISVKADPILVRTGNGGMAEKQIKQQHPQVTVHEDLFSFTETLLRQD